MTEGTVEVDMRAGRGLCWSDVTADIKAGNPVEASAAESDPLEHYRQRWMTGIEEASRVDWPVPVVRVADSPTVFVAGYEPLGVTPAGDLVFPAQVVGGVPWMI